MYTFNGTSTLLRPSLYFPYTLCVALPLAYGKLAIGGRRPLTWVQPLPRGRHAGLKELEPQRFVGSEVKTWGRHDSHGAAPL
jgi:hypothetical protein